MVSATLMGGLGNNLFQIATAFAISNQYEEELIFDFESVVYGHKSIKNYLKNIFRKLNFVETNKTIENVYYEPNFHHTKIEYSKNMKLHGYFQSEKYFAHLRKKVLDLFEIDYESFNYIQTKYEPILSNDTCSIHVRRGDYLGLEDFHPPCNIEYFNQSKKYFDKNTLYLIFSDDINWCKENFKDDNVVFIENNENYIDLYLMSMCKNNIIANSSFSWWGAWFNKNPNKKVISPKKWFGGSYNHLNTNDLYCKNWITI